MKITKHFPLSILLAMSTTCLMWGWPVEAAVFALARGGILRIGEALLSRRIGLILPQDSVPGVDFILLKIRSPKTGAGGELRDIRLREAILRT